MNVKIKLKTFDLQKIKIKIVGGKKSQIFPSRELMWLSQDTRKIFWKSDNADIITDLDRARQ